MNWGPSHCVHAVLNWFRGCVIFMLPWIIELLYDWEFLSGDFHQYFKVRLFQRTDFDIRRLIE